ncbi:hypothetical protein HV824_28105 [Myxococcus sp. AM009]|uniref:hypothetical protein n=1 Tax=unclassified Myxococcus TaxID=2648731 RepID=UPI0015959962|nr:MULTISPECIES: hypothetical protein [unclassified Myxococcus]NVJ01964.1 hypothetical protein [Myxococcus sp. AM009]NVJ17571.1 hypothetical protein [Myxococcus sp. AM010]
MRTALLAVLSLTAVVSCTSAEATSSKPPASPQEDFFRRPDRVQVFLADMNQQWDLEPDADVGPTSGLFLLTREGPELSRKQRQSLAAIWVSPKEHVPYPPKKCGFNPDIAFRFWRGETWVDAVVCFSCRQLIFHDANGKRIAGSEAGFLDGFPQMVKLAKEAFPQETFNSSW